MKKRIWYCVMLLLIPLVAACASDTSLTHPVLVTSRDQAAAVLISVNTVAPWDQIADALKPDFSLAADQSLQQILPTTQRIQEQVLSAFGMSLGLGLSPGAATSSTPIPQAPTGVPAGGELPSTAAVSGDIGIDPVLKYQAALALYQAVQLMNREVQNAAVVFDYVPYVVTVKFAIIPYQPNMPYDVHARISFFPAVGAHFVPPKSPSDGSPSMSKIDDSCRKMLSQHPEEDVARLPQVMPLLVTDDIERALKSRAVEAALQLGLALSAASHGVGGSLAANYVNQALSAISGQDINSRMTVTRLSDNVIYARIGAAYQATSGRALVGQTYNVSFLLLVPGEYFEKLNRIPKIEVYTHTELRNAFNGTILPDRPPSTLVRQIDNAMQPILRGHVTNELLAAWERTDDVTKEKIGWALVVAIQESNYEKFGCVLKNVKIMSKHGGASSFCYPPDDCKSEESSTLFKKIRYSESLWTSLSAANADSAFKWASFELPLPSKISIAKQTALLLDDMKDNAKIQLQVNADTPNHMITAALVFNTMDKDKQNQAEYRLLPQEVSLNPNSGILTLTFPSPAKLGMDEKEVSSGQLKLSRRCPPSARPLLCPELDGQQNFPLRYIQAKTDKTADAGPDLSFTAKVTQVTAKAGIGVAIVTIDKVKDDYALIAVDDADVKSATDERGAEWKISNGTIRVDKNQTKRITFQLYNLHSGMTFTIRAEGHKGSTRTGQKVIQFTVIGV